MTRLLLGQLAPVPASPDANVDRIVTAVRARPCDLAIFPELFLSGYRVGDRFHELSLRKGDARWRALSEVARSQKTTVVVGAPVASEERRGELQNSVLLFRPDGTVGSQVKRYLPTFGPFEEGVPFTPTDVSRPVSWGEHSLGLAICYDVFFPEVFRVLALGGAGLFVVVSASPVTSHPLFAKLLPARAIENGLPIVYVNRVGVEDGIVFGGGSGLWDARGEPCPLEETSGAGLSPEEKLLQGEIDLNESARWRPFRPVLRDVATRPAPASLP
ncbi:MAG: carbon-nitrogen hydrolase family protein [Thermoplasmata archaeon]|nr:carbon-nitrogen hydrolase family protein [Thermoplasmata archaeon]